MIAGMLKQLVECYMQSEFENHGRDIGFYVARAELLKNAKISVYKNLTNTPQDVYDTDGNAMPTPICADVYGVFQTIETEIKTPCSITVTKVNGVMLLCCDNVYLGAVHPTSDDKKDKE